MKISFESVKVKIGSVMAFLLLINVVTVMATFVTASKQEKDGAYINVAGRQRMLSQKMTKEALLFARTGDEKWQKKLQETAGLFDTSLRSMRDGNTEKGFKRTEDPVALQEIKKLEELWKPFKENITKIGTAVASQPEIEESVRYLVENNIPILRQANILTKRYEQISVDGIQRLKIMQMVMLAAGVLVFILGSWLLLQHVVKPLMNMVPVVRKIADGDLFAKCRIGARGELGALAGAVNEMVEKLLHTVENIKKGAEEVANSSIRLDRVSSEVSVDTSRMSTFSKEVAETAETVHANIEAVAEASKELTTATTEIAQSVAQTASITNDAQEKAQSANMVIQRLGESSDKIGGIIQVINTIAEQTNLLALNATIEAARAGEAGKGFAVVANEIKELAAQTSGATDEITGMIQTIQRDTEGAVTSVEEITSIVAQINDLANTIASAAEEQTATVSEISSNLEYATDGVAGVRENMDHAADSGVKVAETARKTSEAAKDLSDLADQLQEAVQIFRTSAQE